MRYKLYTTSRRAWRAMFNEIDRAKTSIYIEMYIFLEDTAESYNFIEKLESKAKAGVRVVVIVDAFGSFALKSKTIAGLRRAGVEFMYFGHWLRRNHRKIIIIDERLAFLGGVNIEKKIGHWRDIQIMLEGKKTVKAILRSFAYTYKISGGRNQKILRYYKWSILKKIRYWLVENIPTGNLNSLAEYYQDRIIKAEKSLKIVTPYFLPPRWLMGLLDAAARRGVKVEIIIPRDTDIEALNKINYYNLAKLIPAGVKVYGSRRMNHAKLMIIDDRESIVGSQNIDFLSFGINMESGVFSKQKNLAKDLVRIFSAWKRDSLQFSSLKQDLRIKDRLVLFFFKIFNSFL